MKIINWTAKVPHNITTTPQPFQAPDSLAFSGPITILLALLASMVSLCTIGGNLLVLVAFVVQRNIRTATNYFIASLAVTDLLIGLISMNVFTAYLLLGYWPMGQLFCDFWLSIDYTACLTSQYTVFFITVDRFCSVKIPAKYRDWRTDSKVTVMVVFTWIIPSSIFFTSILGWPLFTGGRGRSVGQCFAEFTTYPIFNTVLTIGYFWVTLVVMFVLYAGIYHVAWQLHKRSQEKKEKMTSLMAMAAGTTMSRIGVGVNWSGKLKKNSNDDNSNIQRSSKGDIEETEYSEDETHLCEDSFQVNEHPVTHSFSLPHKSTRPRSSILATIESPEQTKSVPNNRPSESSTLSVPPPTPASTGVGNSSPNPFTQNDQSAVNWQITLNAPPEIFANLRFIDQDSSSCQSGSSISLCDSETQLLRDIFTKPVFSEQDIELEERDVFPPAQEPLDIVNCSAGAVNSRSASYKSGLRPLPVTRKALSFNGFKHNEPKRTASYSIPFREVARKLTTRARPERSNRGRDNATRTENRAKKALRTISLILGAFVACWTPYHIIVLVKGFCDNQKSGSSCVNDHLYNVAYWLCYMNSPINPFCYALANAQFKTTFTRLLKGDFHKR